MTTRSRRLRRSGRHPWEDLAEVDYFRGLPAPALRTAARGADWCDVPAGTRLQRQGMHVRWVWVVAAGALEAREDGELRTVILPGAAHGEPEVLLGAASPVELVAAVTSSVLSLPAPVFHGLLAEPSFATAVGQRLARRVLDPAPEGPQAFGSSGNRVTSTTSSAASA